MRWSWRRGMGDDGRRRLAKLEIGIPKNGILYLHTGRSKIADITCFVGILDILYLSAVILFIG